LLALLVGVELIEGQRASYLLLTPAVALILALRGKLWTVPVAALTLGLVMLVVGLLTGSAGLERVRELSENRGNVFGSHAEAFWSYTVIALENAPIGLGVGATSLGTRYVANSIPLFIEVPLAKVVADLSLVGLIAYLWLFGTLCLTSFRAQARASRAGAASTASLLAAILVYQMLATIGGYELAIDALPVWFLSGAAASLAATVADPPEAGRSPVARGRAPMHGASQ